MDAIIVHIAAVPMRAGSVIRQRCAWCGALIDEVDVDRVAWQAEPGDDTNPFIEEDGSPKMRWQGLVAVSGGAKWSVDDPADGCIPEDSCMNLDAAVTG